jgi:endonuclease/exonuclease/phosphatase (EEP) superfamily protein YafD
MKKLAAAINATTEPLVLGGDFNASILAPDVSRMLRTAKLKTAVNEPATWPVGMVRLGTAIDHLVVREPLAIASIRRLDNNFGSNHFGLVAELVLP